MRKCSVRTFLAAAGLAVTLGSVAANAARATDWPTWRFDAGRTAATSEQLPARLRLQWTRVMPALTPAWPEDPRLQFDAAYEPVVSGDLLVVASSRNDSVMAFRLKTGEQRWQFFAEGPVRFAPLLHDGRVYFGADDGALYCLDAETGVLQWRFVAAPTDRKAIGSERVISVWPVRGGPVLVDGKIHFTVGVWPFEGTFLYSIDPRTGRPDGARSNIPAGQSRARVAHDVVTLNNVTPQGYLAATDATLFIPQGRSAVATVDRATGRFGSHRYSTSGVTTWHVAAQDRWLFHGAVTYDLAAKRQISSTTRTPVVANDVMYAADGSAVSAFDLTDVRLVEQTDRRGKKRSTPVLSKLWTVPLKTLHGDLAPAVSAQLSREPLVVDLRAGNRLFGHQGRLLFSLDLATGRNAPVLENASAQANATVPTVSWRKTLDQNIASMVAANGCLVVTTRDGSLHCFSRTQTQPVVYRLAEPRLPEPDVDWSARVAMLLEEQNPGDAYCVCAGIGSGGLITELVRQSRLRLIVIDPDPQQVASLRDRFDRLGIYGSRLVAHVGDPLTFRLPAYMANLVVSETPAAFGLTSRPDALAGLYRILRPYGGTAVLVSDAAQHEQMKETLAAAALEPARLLRRNGLSQLTRPGALPGSADWTHEYGDASNTLMSHDTLVKAPLGVLWFGGPAADGSLFYNRHFWGPSMAVVGGRMFLQGPEKLTAVDVYTGRILWKIPLEGEANYLPGRRGNDFEGHLSGYNFLAVEDAIYLVHEKSCLKLDPATGEQVNEFRLQNPDDDWGRIRVVGDRLIAEVFRQISSDRSSLPPGRQLLAGTRAPVEIVAIDRNTGSRLWSHEAQASFPVMAVGTDLVFAFDGALEGFYRDWKRRGVIPKASDVRMVRAIDLKTGKLVWKKPTSLIGTWMSYSDGRDVVLMSNKSAITAIDGHTGKELWKQSSEGVGFRGHPESLWDRVIVWNDRLLDQRGPGLAWDLRTGQRVPRLHPITGEQTPWEFTKSGHHCNYAIASPHLMTFRADTAGFCDIESGNTSRLNGFRSGCRNSLIPANGVLNAPNMASGCICGYSLFTSLALVHLPETEVWSYSALKFDPKKDAVRRVGINFGAPGDRQDAAGTLWLDYPNTGGSSPTIPVNVAARSPRYFHRHATLLRGDGLKWVAGSGIEGATAITLTLDPDDAASPQLRTVRLYFSEPDDAQPGERIFDIAIEGQPVLKEFDIAREAGGTQRVVVREFPDVLAGSRLTVALTPRQGRTVISGIEVVTAD